MCKRFIKRKHTMPTIGKKLIENGAMANEKVLWLEMVNA